MPHISKSRQSFSKKIPRHPRLITINRYVDTAAQDGFARNFVLAKRSQIHFYNLLYYFGFHAFLSLEFFAAKITPYRGILLKLPKKNGRISILFVLDLNSILESYYFLFTKSAWYKKLAQLDLYLQSNMDA